MYLAKSLFSHDAVHSILFVSRSGISSCNPGHTRRTRDLFVHKLQHKSYSDMYHWGRGHTQTGLGPQTDNGYGELASVMNKILCSYKTTENIDKKDWSFRTKVPPSKAKWKIIKIQSDTQYKVNERVQTGIIQIGSK